MKAQRAVWGDTLTELARTDDRIVVVDGDLATSTMAVTFAEAHPDRFVQAGIAEQNMVGIAFGMSTLGYRPWLSSFGVFLTNRALDQVRMLVSQTKAPSGSPPRTPGCSTARAARPTRTSRTCR